MYKRIFAAFAMLTLCACLLTGCSEKQKPETDTDSALSTVQPSVSSDSDSQQDITSETPATSAPSDGNSVSSAQSNPSDNTDHTKDNGGVSSQPNNSVSSGSQSGSSEPATLPPDLDGYELPFIAN